MRLAGMVSCALLVVPAVSACGGSSDIVANPIKTTTGCGYQLTSTEISANVGDTVQATGTFNADESYHFHVYSLVGGASDEIDVPATRTAGGLIFVMPKVRHEDFDTLSRTFQQQAFLLDDLCPTSDKATAVLLVPKPVFQYQGVFHYHLTYVDSINHVDYDVTANATMQSQIGNRQYVDTHALGLPIVWAVAGTEKDPYASQSYAVTGGGAGMADGGEVFMALHSIRQQADIDFHVIKKNGVVYPGGFLDLDVATPSVLPNAAEAQTDPNTLTIHAGSYRQTDANGSSLVLQWPDMQATQLHCTGNDGTRFTGCSPI